MIYFILLGFILIALFIGLLLPKERIATSEAFYKASPEEVYKVVTNNDDYAYRSDLKELIILERNGDFEVWDEIAKNGNKIRFRTARKEPFSRYDMEMESKIFTGYWIGEFREMPNGGTHFITTEKITMPNPIYRIMNYTFFSLKTFMDVYKNDVRKKLGE